MNRITDHANFSAADHDRDFDSHTRTKSDADALDALGRIPELPESKAPVILRQITKSKLDGDQLPGNFRFEVPTKALISQKEQLRLYTVIDEELVAIESNSLIKGKKL